jgi:UDP-N-acetylglucosamine acyltransferase
MKPQPYLHPNAKIAPNVVVEPFTCVYEDVEIGEGTWIGPNVTIMSGTRIGKNCKIFPGAVIGAIPQDLKYKGENTIVEIGDNTVIRECVTINKGTSDKMKTVVGSNCLIMAYVHIAHDCIVGNNCILANCVNLAGHVEIEDNAILEGLVAVQQFVKIGEFAFITGASLVRKNVPPYCKAAREPLAYAGINSVGLKRNNFADDDIKLIEDLYRVIFIQNNNISKALEIVDSSFAPSSFKTKISTFIQQSEKGIMKGLLKGNSKKQSYAN